jgi:hypothetical protein
LSRKADPATPGQNSLIISVHVPKAAGTTFSRYLLNAFPDGVLRDYEPITPEVAELFDTSFSWLNSQLTGDGRTRLISYGILKCKKLVAERGIRVIHGHFNIDKYLGIFPDATYVTWLRDPLERALSQYNFFKRTLMDPPDLVNSLIYEGKLPFEEWMTLPVNINLQQQFTGPDLSKFKFVGIAEQFERSLSIFRKLVGLEHERFDLETTPENVNPDKSIRRSYDELDSGTRALFLELNYLDQAMYSDAVEQLDQMESDLRGGRASLAAKIEFSAFALFSCNSWMQFGF